MAYSNSSGGTLTLPSPTHVHHVDVNAAVRSLRRSMSRSPSKFRLVRTASQASEGSADMSQSPSPRSPGRSSSPAAQNNATATPAPASSFPSSFPSSSFPSSSTPHAATPSPFQTNIRLSVRSARPKPTITRPLPRQRASPKSPLKRVLGSAPDSGNSASSSSSPSPEAPGQENTSIIDSPLASSPPARRNPEKSSRHSMHLDISGASKHSFFKSLDIKSDAFPVASVSPLKRSDATMNPDHTGLGSPVAKRRSLHGISGITSDSSVFDQPSSSTSPPSAPADNFDIHEDGNHEYQLTGSATCAFPDLPPPTPTAMPRRSSSLRKTTLQQRHGDTRSSLGRRQGEKHLAQLSQDAVTPPVSRIRPRLSLDQYLPPEPRGSPFTAQPNGLPNPSMHTTAPPTASSPAAAAPTAPAVAMADTKPAHQPHPLSRTLTQSSSGSSFPADDSPTHVPVQLSDKPRSSLNFSKSLPLGAQRPPTGPSVATPHYKSAIPLQSAFMSTGLVSKMNRNPERESPGARGGGGPSKPSFVPDTPCKKQPYASNTFPPQFGSGRRHSRPSFGSPSSPFTPVVHHQAARPGALGNSDKLGSIFFKPIGAGHARRGSLLSLDGDDAQGSMDADFPPTPTKNVLFRTSQRPGPGPAPAPDHARAFPGLFGPVEPQQQQQASSLSSCKSIYYSQSSPTTGWTLGGDQPYHHAASPHVHAAAAGPPMSPYNTTGHPPTGPAVFWPPYSYSPSPYLSSPYSPTPYSPTPYRPSHYYGFPPYGHSPYYGPYSTAAMNSPTFPPSGDLQDWFAKHAFYPPASPSAPEFMGNMGATATGSPRTPQEAPPMGPPDPSRLSISNPYEDRAPPSASGRAPQPVAQTPATPTAQGGREAFPPFGGRRVITPVNGQQAQPSAAADEGLIMRFDKAEAVGKGEFSEVFRVVKSSPAVSFAATPFATTPARRTPSDSRRVEVFAVKKSRIPFHGPRDREAKLREVSVLKALCNSDHVVHYVDSWEHNSHLYIQTEYCDEGSLDRFLEKIGKTGRLDDFRIWKVMLELCQGLLSIHGSGFIHLDLKPANIFITQGGALKIGDFGLATTWPAERGTDGEGDREYIAPEILVGQIDKPADVYALGLIILEIACNVFLPENGPTWVALREGDMSVVPSLTGSSSVRDATGEDELDTRMRLSNIGRRRSFPMTHDASNLFGTPKRSELQDPPPFMSEAGHPSSLDALVASMIRPDPADRPTADQLLSSEGLVWVAARRQAGATVYEGNWGPGGGQSDQDLADESIADSDQSIADADDADESLGDTEMIDV